MKKRKNTISPQFVKSSTGKKTHVYLSFNDYEKIIKKLKEYDCVKKKDGIRWVRESKEK